jgi:signal peptidase I
VPAGQYFVLGDNRSNSRDSHLGWFVPAENMIGRAWLTYWPPASWGVMPSVAYAVDR